MKQGVSMGTNEKKRVRNIKQAILLAGIIVLFVGGLFLYRQQVSERRHAAIEFVNPSGKISALYKLEVADTEALRVKGLMFRKPDEIPDNGGMLFIFSGEEVRTFWMRNTYTSLDMIFLDRSYRVVGILARVPILNEEPRRVEAASKYIVELKAGMAAKDGITIGSVARIR
jgi:uncharacterized protein